MQGSLEPVVNSLNKLGNEKLKVKILLEGTGNISESDVNLAVASAAIIIGFNVEIDQAAHREAEASGVDIRLYNIIYKLIDDVGLEQQLCHAYFFKGSAERLLENRWSRRSAGEAL